LASALVKAFDGSSSFSGRASSAPPTAGRSTIAMLGVEV
jgi:hypothetical protein